MLGHLTITAVSPVEVEGWHGSLAICYCDVFGGPPWNEAEHATAVFLERLKQKAALEGFRMVLAVGHRGKLVGFAYGATAGHGELRPCYAGVTKRLGPGVTDAALVGAFELVDLDVVPQAQGHGVGSWLHDELLAGAVEPRAWLMTRSDAVAARAFYHRRGWLDLATLDLPGLAQPRLLMTRRL